jgi:hypothetical protein
VSVFSDSHASLAWGLPIGRGVIAGSLQTSLRIPYRFCEARCKRNGTEAVLKILTLRSIVDLDGFFWRVHQVKVRERKYSLDYPLASSGRQPDGLMRPFQNSRPPLNTWYLTYAVMFFASLDFKGSKNAS